MTPLPTSIDTEDTLDDVLTQPSAELIAHIKTLRGPLVILGAGGKMGPTLAVRARRAVDAAGTQQDVIAVSRFSDTSKREWLKARGVWTLNSDLFSREVVRGLPQSENVIYLAGLKFGTTQNPSLTWAMNTLVPAMVAERYPKARIVALSSGNIYPFVPVNSGGATEDHPLTPLGEYPNACIARERLFEHFSLQNGTKMVFVRLSYAVELRYGVLVDIAQKVFNGESVDVTANKLNWIWQGDANDMIVRLLDASSSPPGAVNMTAREPLSIRAVAEQFGKLMNKPVTFTGAEAETALLSNTAKLCARLGEPRTTLETVMAWVADWIQRGGRTLGKPTHFEVRDGQF